MRVGNEVTLSKDDGTNNTGMDWTSTPTPKMTTTTYYQQQPVETKVMVMERLMSPLRSKVQKLDPVPPGQVPKTKRPSLN